MGKYLHIPDVGTLVLVSIILLVFYFIYSLINFFILKKLNECYDSNIKLKRGSLLLGFISIASFPLWYFIDIFLMSYYSRYGFVNQDLTILIFLIPIFFLLYLSTLFFIFRKKQIKHRYLALVAIIVAVVISWPLYVNMIMWTFFVQHK